MRTFQLQMSFFIGVVALSIFHPAFGQSADKDANAIAQALRDVDVKMTHPDPDMRLAFLETIVAEGNARKIERAIKLAVAGPDDGLRALGFRAYIASTGSIPFDILVTAQEKQAIDDNRVRRTPLARHLQAISAVGYTHNLQFEPAPINTVRGFVKADYNTKLEYSMRGSRLTFSGLTIVGERATCNWEIRPTKDLKVLATMACQGWERPMQLEASLY